jgi:hypothetical protein
VYWENIKIKNGGHEWNIRAFVTANYITLEVSEKIRLNTYCANNLKLISLHTFSTILRVTKNSANASKYLELC